MSDVLAALEMKIPIVLAPMGLAAGPELVAAVSNAGGLGMIPLWRADLSVFAEQVRAVRSLTSRPFGVNLNLIWPQEERLAACIDEGVGIVHFFWGDPGHLVGKAHAAGLVVMQTVGTAAEARNAVDAGVDIVVAQGFEAGGHVWGKVTTMALVPAVVDAVGPTPVFAAGGIADGRGLAAVLALGASAGWIGTRFLATPEANVHQLYRDKLLAAGEADTYLGTVFDIGWPSDAPGRTLRNRTVIGWEEAGEPPQGARPGEGDVVAVSPTSGTFCVTRLHCLYQVRQATSMPWLCGPARVSGLSIGSSLPPMSSTKSGQRPRRRSRNPGLDDSPEASGKLLDLDQGGLRLGSFATVLRCPRHVRFSPHRYQFAARQRIDEKTAQRQSKAPLTRSTTKLRDRFAGTLRPLSRQAIRQSAYCQRRCAVARAIPNRQQIAFHGAPSARAQTSFASSGLRKRDQVIVSSIRLIAEGDGGGRRIGSGVWPTRSLNSSLMSGQVLK